MLQGRFLKDNILSVLLKDTNVFLMIRYYTDGSQPLWRGQVSQRSGRYQSQIEQRKLQEYFFLF